MAAIPRKREREIERWQRDEMVRLTENTAIQMAHVLLIIQKEPVCNPLSSIFYPPSLFLVLFRQQLQLLFPKQQLPLPESGEKTWIIWFQRMSALIAPCIHHNYSKVKAIHLKYISFFFPTYTQYTKDRMDIYFSERYWIWKYEQCKTVSLPPDMLLLLFLRGKWHKSDVLC